MIKYLLFEVSALQWTSSLSDRSDCWVSVELAVLVTLLVDSVTRCVFILRALSHGLPNLLSAKVCILVFSGLHCTNGGPSPGVTAQQWNVSGLQVGLAAAAALLRRAWSSLD